LCFLHLSYHVWSERYPHIAVLLDRRFIWANSSCFSIGMLTKNESKKIRALGQKKYRDRYGEFVAEGDKLVKEVIGSAFQITGIYATFSWLDENRDKVPEGCFVKQITEHELKGLSRQTTPNRVIAVIKMPEKRELPKPGNQLILITENIQDPGNFGTIIRTAEWFGIKNMICSEDTVDLYNPKVIQATMGSFCRVSVFYADIIDYLRLHRNKVPVYGSFLKGNNAFRFDFKQNAIIVLGNESQGISAETEKFVTHKITIRNFNDGRGFKPDSLNVSVAAAILMAIIRSKGQ